MKWPIDTATLLMANLKKRDFEHIHAALLYIAKRLQLSAPDAEQISMAMRIVKSHDNFLESDSIATAEKTLLVSDEGQKIYNVIKEISENGIPQGEL